MQTIIKRVLILLLGWTLLPTSILTASVFIVSNTQSGGSGSLADAVAQAMPGDTIDARNISGVIMLDTALQITVELDIWGPGADRLTLDGQNQTRHFRISEQDSLYLEGVELINGMANADTDPVNPLGGSILNLGLLDVVSCIFQNNQAIVGGAIFSNSGGQFESRTWIRDCGFYNNAANQPTSALPQGGGALSGDARGGGEAKFWAYNSTFSGNLAIRSGGAVFLLADPAGGARFEGLNCTITDNTANGFCGGIDNSLAEACLLRNSILAGNHGSGAYGDLFGTLFSIGHNLIGDDTSLQWSSGTAPANAIVNVDPGLAPLAKNGSVFFTHALGCGSPAIDTGVDSLAPLSDLRGQVRIGPSDLGAHERNEALDLAITNLGENGLGSLRQAILLTCSGDTLYADQIQGTIHLTSEIEIDKTISIVGNQQRSLVLSGDLTTRLFLIQPNAELALSWLTLRKGAPSLYGGGAILNRGHLQISHSTLQDNRAESGGAIANYGNLDSVSLVLSNCTFSNNQATALDGGAIDNRPFSFGASLEMNFCTITDNQAANKGGGIYSDASGDVMLQNSLIGGNQAPRGPDIFGTAESLGNNLLSNSQDATLNGGSADLLDQDPMLDILGNYGGPTFTHRLLAGSPAIDAASNSSVPMFDQRGEARIFNAIADIGAYEYDPATSIDTDLDWHIRAFPNPTDGDLTVEISQVLPHIEIRLLDMNGCVLRRDYFSHTQIHLSLSDLPKGLYLLTIRSGKEQVHQKIVLF